MPPWGTSIGFDYPGSEKMELTIATFDDPSQFRPTSHFGAKSMHRARINTEGFTEQRSDQYQLLVDRWMNAVGKLPSQA